MSLAIAEPHTLLASTVRDMLRKRGTRQAAHVLLEHESERLPAVWSEIAELGWLGLHVPEEFGGSGYGLLELLIVVEEFGRALLPGPALPTLIASALISTAGDDDLRSAYLSRLTDGTCPAAVALDADLTDHLDLVSGTVEFALGAGTAELLLLPCRGDVMIVEAGSPGLTVDIPENLDPSRRGARLTLRSTPRKVLAGAAASLTDLARLVFAAEAVGVARECTELAADYASTRQQFGRPIGTFQAVKHHCANMLVATELATAAVWDAASSHASEAGAEFSLGCASAATLAAPAGYLCANLAMQVHGGIGFTWEHVAHLYLRRAAVLQVLIAPGPAAAHVSELTCRGTRRPNRVVLPPEADSFREEVTAFVAQVRRQSSAQVLESLLDNGYLMPHWPTPWGRGAGPVEQLVIEQELARAGIARPEYGITEWLLLTLVDHANDEQSARWVAPALRRETQWCQLFSEPDAGSDAAGIRTRGERVDGGWIVSGQKVWTSSAQDCAFGLATVRTDPSAPKHAGVTVMVLDMRAPGVDVRPLRTATGASDFNEVFLTDVFVPDADVVGPVNEGWSVARSALGNESVSLGGSTLMTVPVDDLVAALEATGARVGDHAVLAGRYLATQSAIAALNLRRIHRSIVGRSSGAEGNISKLALAELAHDAAELCADLAGFAGAYVEGPGAYAANQVLVNRLLSIAGGTSEIKRNQIGERLLGLPRDPLLR